MKRGFSLIELLVVIAIMAMLLAVALPNYLGARERARDAKRKQDMQQMKYALQLYFNDFKKYPAAASCGKTNYISGCDGTTYSVSPCCPCSASVDFAVGASCDTIYMKKFPSNFGNLNISYFGGGTDFCLKAKLENAADPEIALSKTRCASACGSDCSGTTDYCLCAD